MKRSIWAFLIIGAAVISSVLVLMLLMFEWFRATMRKLFRRQNALHPAISPPIDNTSAKHLIITVHGTFARGANWTQLGEGLHSKISARHDGLGIDCSWHNFEWSGENTVAARREAIESLSFSLSEIFSANPHRNVILVAHSHGGNIALKASENFFENPNLRLVTMATPFLFAQRRPSTRRLLYVLPIVNGTAAACIGAGAANLIAWWFTLPIPDYAIYAVAIAFSIATILREMLGQKSLRRDQDDLLKSSPDISKLYLVQDKLLICSRLGDEADGGLKLASLASSWISKNIGEVKFVPPGLGLATRGKITTKRVVRILFSLVNLARKFKPSELAILIFGSMCLEILHRAVGTRTALAAVTIAVSSSETPPGFWNHYQSKFSVNRVDVILSHSQIYLDPLVLSTITDWLYPNSRSPIDIPGATSYRT